MLSNLRPGAPVYVIYRNGPRVTTAKVAQLSSQYPPQFNFQMPPAGTLSPMFDLSLDIDGKAETFQRIPINTSVAEFPDRGIIISETREGVINEINAMHNLATSELEKRPYWEGVQSTCKKILVELNPEAKREQEQAKEIAALKEQIKGMTDQLAGLSGMLKSMGKNQE